MAGFDIPTRVYSFPTIFQERFTGESVARRACSHAGEPGVRKSDVNRSGFDSEGRDNFPLAPPRQRMALESRWLRCGWIDSRVRQTASITLRHGHLNENRVKAQQQL